jgi:hypothetical protein
VPLPLLPVVGACVVDCRPPLLVELELVLVPLVSRALLEAGVDALPAYEAAAT